MNRKKINRNLVENPSTSNRTLIRNLPRRSLGVFASICVWLALISAPKPSAGPHPDLSWMEAYAHFFKRNFQAGYDYIFTYGPLGYFYTQPYDSELYWLGYAWEIAFKTAIAGIFLRFARGLPSAAGLGFCLALVVAAALVLHSVGPDNLLLVALLLAALQIGRIEGPVRLHTLLAFALLAALLALTKFTLLVYGSATIALLALQLFLRKCGGRAILLIGSYAGFLTALWIVLGQSISHIPAYLQTSMEISTGYVEGMIVVPDPIYPICGAALLIAFGLSLAPLNRQDLRAFASRRNGPLLFLLLFALALGWKHAFIRADPAHTTGFFALGLLLIFALPTVMPEYRWRQRIRVFSLSAALLLSAVLLVRVTSFFDVPLPAFTADHLAMNIRYVVNPGGWKKDLEEYRTTLADQWSLPNVQKQVGSATIDLFSYEQGVLFLNGLNWRPRPIFQSYSAYTPKLLEANAAFFRSASSPEYVLVKREALDNRLEATEDAPALREIEHRYDPQFVEKGFLLLRKRTEPRKDFEWKSTESTIGFGERMPVDPDGTLMISLHFELSSWGQLRKFVYALPEVVILLGIEGGKTQRKRIVPAMTESGFVLSPLIEDAKDLKDYLEAKPSKRIVWFQIESNDADSYFNRIRIAEKRLK